MTAETSVAEPASPYRVAPVPGLDRQVGLSRLLFHMVRNPLEALPAAIYSEPYVQSRRGARRVLLVADPALVEAVLVREVEAFPKSAVIERVLRPVLGDGLLTAEGSSWRVKRRLAAPAFAPARIRAHAGEMAAPFAALAGRWAAGGIVDVRGAMTGTTFEVILSTLFSGDAAIDRRALSRAIDDYLNLSTWVIAYASLGVPGWAPRYGRRRMDEAAGLLRAAVRRFVEGRRGEERPPRDLAADLMAARDRETGAPLSDDDLVDMMLTLIAAGHETSATGLTWALHLLAEQPHWQERLAEEAAAVLPAAGIGPDDPARLVLTERFVKEAMRLYPPAAILERVAARDITVGRIEVRRGEVVSIPVYAIHRNSRLWERPDLFDTDRFLPEREAARPRTAYMPFGAGPRVCIGGAFAMQEMAVALATLVRSLRFAPASTVPPVPVSAVTLRPKGGLKLRVAPR